MGRNDAFDRCAVMSRRLHPIIREVCLWDVDHDYLHSTTGALFDINEVWLALGEQTAHDYRPGMTTGPEPDSAAEMILEAVQNGSITLDDLRTSYAVIDRYDNILRSKGHEL
jgi:hypothetical protein